MTSTVKKWKEDGSYGFIANPDGGKDIFVHSTDIKCPGRRILFAGQTVTFETVPTDKGPRAINVVPKLD
jgi:CspA family cold shock protein